MCRKQSTIFWPVYIGHTPAPHPPFLPFVRSGLRGRAVNTFAPIPKGPGLEPRRRPFFLFLLLSPLLSPLSFFHRFVHCKSSSHGVDQGSAQTWADPCSTPGCCSRSGQCVDPLSHERVALKLQICQEKLKTNICGLI